MTGVASEVLIAVSASGEILSWDAKAQALFGYTGAAIGVVGQFDGMP
jgi:hypothetical protein